MLFSDASYYLGFSNLLLQSPCQKGLEEDFVNFFRVYYPLEVGMKTIINSLRLHSVFIIFIETLL